MWQGIDIADMANRAAYGSNSLLDLGCGTGQSSSLFTIPAKVGVDGFEKYSFEYIKNSGGEFVKGDLRKISEMFPSKTFDTVVAWDVIEHLIKDEGIKLLTDMERIAIKQVIVFTPFGMYEQNDDPLGENNEFNIHRSGWMPEDFLRRFFDVAILKNYFKVNGQDAIFANKRVG